MIEIESSPIQFFTEDTTFQLEHTGKVISWIKQVIAREEWELVALNFIFCSDAYLYNINMEYLQHDTLTDVITFYYSTEKVEGDIFISVERVQENAQKLNVTFEEELHRIMVHGTLHLLGYGDKSPSEKTIMTQKENHYLSLRA